MAKAKAGANQQPSDDNAVTTPAYPSQPPVLWGWVAVIVAILAVGWMVRSNPFDPVPVPAAKAVIAGPQFGPVGQPIRLDGSNSTGDEWEWNVPAPAQAFPVDDDGREILILSQQPVTITITLTVRDFEQNRLTKSTANHVVQIGGHPPAPGPGPQPYVPPAPPPVDRWSSLATQAAMSAPDPQRSATAQRLAVSFRQLASNSTGYQTPVEFASATIQQWDAATGRSPAWDQAKRTIFSQLNAEIGPSASVPAIAAVYPSLAAGFEAVR